MADETSEIDELLRRVALGDSACWQELVERSRERLRRMVAFRLDDRLQGRVDPSDVPQNAYLEAWRNLPASVEQPVMPFFLWLRGIAGNKVLDFHRYHLGARMRDLRREVAIDDRAVPASTTTALAAQLLGDLTRASEKAIRFEVRLRLQETIDTMDPLDREILVLRHFEQLSPAETAQVLGIKQKTAGMRYMGALRRLKEILSGLEHAWLEA
jgi:RNA polymerase sigma-70 factor (ECF subfamily)